MMKRSLFGKKDRPLLYRIGSLALPHKRELILGLVFLGLGSGVNLLFPEILRRLLNTANSSLLSQHIIEIALGMLTLFAVQGICIYLRSYWFAAIGHKVVAALRSKLYRTIVDQDLSFFDSNRSGDLVSRLSSDCSMLQNAVSVNLSVLIRYALQVAVGVVLMCILSLKLSAAILVSVPLLVVISIILGKRLKIASRLMQDELGTANTVAEETIYAMRTVKAFAKEAHESKRYKSAVDRALNYGLSRSSVASFLQAFVSFLMNASIVLVFAYGVHLVLITEISYGDLTGFLLYGIIVAVSFAFLASTYAEFAQSLGAAERIFEVLDRKVNMLDPASPKKLSQPARGAIEFKAVSFAYPSRSDLTVLHDISFKVVAGQTLAVVGPSGGGKSTLMALILRLYDPSRGNVTFDGIDLRELTLLDLRSAIAIVPQEPELFSVSIAENLRYGKADASEAELERACAEANILDFINTLPSRFKTNVGDRGVQISAGQKQRIAIARAILKNPALLLLDEATSALDSENEVLVQDALRKLMHGRTTIVIAHRLATIQDADSVIVLDRGAIVQTGKHETLRREVGLYQQLVERQELHS